MVPPVAALAQNEFVPLGQVCCCGVHSLTFRFTLAKSFSNLRVFYRRRPPADWHVDVFLVLNGISFVSVGNTR
jgi:hypothetical protein